jgi:hypothetical protein
MSTPEPSELFAQIETLLDGIDRHEDHPRGGWWQTPDGARIGRIKLRELKELLTSRQTTPPAATREMGSAPPRALVEEWVSEIWHEGTPVLTSASEMHIAARAAHWARVQATREVGKEPLTTAELDALWLATWSDETQTYDVTAYARAVLARWGGAAVQPVAVSERLPSLMPDDTDFSPKGEIWWYESRLKWRLGDRNCIDYIPYPTHWLPHWALPVPAADEGEGQDNG